MKRLPVILTAFGLAVSLTAVLAAVGSAATRSAVKAPMRVTITIQHQTRGCHAWSVSGSAFRATQSVRLSRGGTITFVDNDVMPHRLVQTSGPAVHYIGSPSMRKMSASVKATFSRAGVYRFTTKPGEDYVRGVKTVGPDNVLGLTVTVA